jgi:hypothetical protein
MCFSDEHENKFHEQALSLKDFREGKTWIRYGYISNNFSMVPSRLKPTMINYKIIQGYTDSVDIPTRIVIEITNDYFNATGGRSYRAIIDSQGAFVGFEVFHGRWEPWGGTYEAKKGCVAIINEPGLHFSYVFLPLPILWRDTAFVTDDYTGRYTKVETKVVNQDLQVSCTVFNVGKSEVTLDEASEKKLPVYDKIEMVFKKGEPWAYSVVSRRHHDMKLSPENVEQPAQGGKAEKGKE